MQNKIATTTSQERLAKLRSLLILSIDSLKKAADVLAEMDRMGDDVSSVPCDVLRALRRIYSRSMLPEVYVNLEGRLRQRVAMLAIPYQKMLSDPRYEVALLPELGAEPITTPIGDLTPKQVDQVFSRGAIRSIKEQKEWIVAQDIKTAIPLEPQTPEEQMLTLAGVLMEVVVGNISTSKARGILRAGGFPPKVWRMVMAPPRM